MLKIPFQTSNKFISTPSFLLLFWAKHLPDHNISIVSNGRDEDKNDLLFNTASMPSGRKRPKDFPLMVGRAWNFLRSPGTFLFSYENYEVHGAYLLKKLKSEVLTSNSSFMQLTILKFLIRQEALTWVDLQHTIFPTETKWRQQLRISEWGGAKCSAKELVGGVKNLAHKASPSVWHKLKWMRTRGPS